MSSLSDLDNPVAGLNAYWRDALDVACQSVDPQVAATAMILVAIQHARSGMGNDGAADLLTMLARGLRDGEMVSLQIGDVVLHLKDGRAGRH